VGAHIYLEVRPDPAPAGTGELGAAFLVRRQLAGTPDAVGVPGQEVGPADPGRPRTCANSDRASVAVENDFRHWEDSDVLATNGRNDRKLAFRGGHGQWAATQKFGD
jgi:hypothetical protein